MSTHLYGLPGAEYMWDDPAAVYELWADVDHDASVDMSDGPSLIIEEWSSNGVGHFLKTASEIMGWLLEWLYDSEITDNVADMIADVTIPQHVFDAFDAARQALAECLPGRMADVHLRDLTVTWDESGGPLLDGEPMYKPAERPPT